MPELGLVEANIKPYAKTCFSMCAVPGKYLVDVLWCQPIKLIQVVSTSEFHEY